MNCKNGFHVLDTSRMPRPNDQLVISLDGETVLATFTRRGYRIDDGVEIVGERCDDAIAMGVITHTILDVGDPVSVI